MVFILILGQNITYLNFNDIHLSCNVTLTFKNRLGLYIYDHCEINRIHSNLGFKNLSKIKDVQIRQSIKTNDVNLYFQ